MPVDPIPISVELKEDPGGSIHRDKLESLFQEITDALGIPGKVQVSLEKNRELSLDRRLSVIIDGRSCHYPEAIWRYAAALIGGEIGIQNTDLAIETLSAAAQSDLLQLVCVEIAKHNADLLLTEANAQAYYREVEARLGGNPTLSFADFYSALRETVSRWVAIGPVEDVVEVISKLVDERGQVTRPALFESLFDRWRPKELGILISAEYLEAILQETPTQDRELFKQSRQWLFDELGTYFPSYVIETTDLPERQFCFRINQLYTLPQIGLAPDECMVNIDPVWLFTVESTGAHDYATGQVQSIIHKSSRANVSSYYGLYSWSSFGYLTLSMGRHLRGFCGNLFDMSVAEALLDSHQFSFPALIEACDAVIDRSELTHFLRQLLDERISIRDLTRIVQAIIDQAPLSIEGETTDMLDWSWTPRDQRELDSPPDLLASVRLALKDMIQDRYADDEGTVSAITLSPQIEEDLRRTSAAVSEINIQEKLIQELDQLEPSSIPIVTSSLENRFLVRRLIQKAFPDRPVLAYPELVPLKAEETYQLGA